MSYDSNRLRSLLMPLALSSYLLSASSCIALRPDQVVRPDHQQRGWATIEQGDPAPKPTAKAAVTPDVEDDEQGDDVDDGDKDPAPAESKCVAEPAKPAKPAKPRQSAGQTQQKGTRVVRSEEIPNNTGLASK